MADTYRIDCRLHVIGCVEADSEEEAKEKFYASLDWEGEEQDCTMTVTKTEEEVKLYYANYRSKNFR